MKKRALRRRYGRTLTGYGPRPISKTRKVRHFSTSENKRGETSYYVTYENLKGHPITKAAFDKYQERYK